MPAVLEDEGHSRKKVKLTATLHLPSAQLDASAGSLLLQARIQHDIGDLDNGCLLHILQKLKPLPDLFSMAATCKVRAAARLPCVFVHNLHEEAHCNQNFGQDCLKLHVFQTELTKMLCCSVLDTWQLTVG